MTCFSGKSNCTMRKIITKSIWMAIYKIQITHHYLPFLSNTRQYMLPSAIFRRCVSPSARGSYWFLLSLTLSLQPWFLDTCDTIKIFFLLLWFLDTYVLYVHFTSFHKRIQEYGASGKLQKYLLFPPGLKTVFFPSRPQDFIHGFLSFGKAGRWIQNTNPYQRFNTPAKL
jgi:hypothetical protein